MNSKQTFMREAISLFEEKMKAGFGGPFGAVIVRNNEIIARGYNKVLSSNDPTAHAEVDAIRKACQAVGNYQLADCELYTSCEPCPMCLGAIYWARLRKVYFGNTRQDAAAIGFDDNFIYEQINIPAEKRHIPMQQLLPHEAKTAFKIWQRMENKQTS